MTQLCPVLIKKLIPYHAYQQLRPRESRTGGCQRMTGIHAPTGSLRISKYSDSNRAHPGLLLLVESTPFSTFGFFSRVVTTLMLQGSARDLAGKPESHLLRSGLSRVERALWLSLIGRLFQDSRLPGIHFSDLPEG